MIGFLLGQLSMESNRGLGYFIFIIAFIAIIFLDKIIKLVIYIVDKLEERKNKKR